MKARNNRASVIVFVVTVFFLFLVDYVSKQWATGTLSMGNSIEVLPVFKLALAYNTGAAFSFLADQPGWQRYFFILISFAAVAFFMYTFVNNDKGNLVSLSCILISAGAVGNVADRIMLGKVVDFLSFHWQQYYFPTFNIADVFIFIGAVIFVFTEMHQD